MNVDITKLTPGVFGVSHGGGMAGELIRSATGSWAGHAFLYLGNGVLVSGQPPKAVQEPADTYPDAIWAWQMWDKLQASGTGWGSDRISVAMAAAAARGRALVGESYDWPAYVAFAAEVLHLRNEEQLAGYFAHDPLRVCSGLVADALGTAGVPLDFDSEDGPGLMKDPGTKVTMPPNLVAPGMLLGLGQRLEWF